MQTILEVESLLEQGESILRGSSDALPGYTLEELIGVGGMSWVFKATQHSLGRYVSIKILADSSEADFKPASFLAREASALSKLSHPNIVRILDVTSIDGRPCLIMDYLDAESLAQILEDGPLSPSTALTIVSQCANALMHAHEMGIIHRDLKPSNILLDREGHAYLVDFGISSLSNQNLNTEHSLKTLTHAGSMAYSPPERLVADLPAAPTEDVYSLAALLYHLVMGHPPHGLFPSLVYEGQPLPELDRIINRGLAHDPASRWPTMRKFYEALDQKSKTEPLAKLANQEEKHSSLLWILLSTGIIFFLVETFLIGFSPTEKFSLPAGRGSKLYDNALALIVCNLIILTPWSYLIWSSWKKSRVESERSSFSLIAACHGAILISIAFITWLAVHD